MKKTTTTKTQDTIKLTYHEVSSVRAIPVQGKEDLIFFSLNLNGVTINNCRVATGKNGDFISFPQYKGKDGRYYNYVWVRLSEEDEKNILNEIQETINQE